jgi:hypothetical protein
MRRASRYAKNSLLRERGIRKNHLRPLAGLARVKAARRWRARHEGRITCAVGGRGGDGAVLRLRDGGAVRIARYARRVSRSRPWEKTRVEFTLSTRMALSGRGPWPLARLASIKSAGDPLYLAISVARWIQTWARQTDNP